LAAQTTTWASAGPYAVSTPTTRPPATRIADTGVSSNSSAPSEQARSISERVVASGSAWPLSGS
jgi:hypothetical protein